MEFKIGTELRFNHYGKTYTGVIEQVHAPFAPERYLVVMTTPAGKSYGITVNKDGEGIAYNSYATAFVKFELTPDTRGALEIIRKAAADAKYTELYQRVLSTAAIPEEVTEATEIYYCPTFWDQLASLAGIEKFTFDMLMKDVPDTAGVTPFRVYRLPNFRYLTLVEPAHMAGAIVQIISGAEAIETWIAQHLHIEMGRRDI